MFEKYTVEPQRTFLSCEMRYSFNVHILVFFFCRQKRTFIAPPKVFMIQVLLYVPCISRVIMFLVRRTYSARYSLRRKISM